MSSRAFIFLFLAHLSRPSIAAIECALKWGEVERGLADALNAVHLDAVTRSPYHGLKLPLERPGSTRLIHRSNSQGGPLAIATEGLAYKGNLSTTATQGNKSLTENIDHRFADASVVVLDVPDSEVSQHFRQFNTPGVVPPQYVRGHFDRYNGFRWVPNPLYDPDFRP